MQTEKDLIHLSDISLLEELCSCENDEAPYSLFVSRFLPDIKAECLRICNTRKLDSHIGLQIAHETFERVRKYKTFKRDQIKLPDERKGIVVYLIRIAIRLFFDHHRKDINPIIHKTYFDNIIDKQNENVNIEELQDKKKMAILILGKLNPKEKKILITDLEYKKHQKYLPDDVTESLANELNIKKDTVRRIRKRAIEKIKKAIDDINQK